MITLVIAEREPVMLKGLVTLFQEVADIQILGTTDALSDAPAVIERLHPDVLLLGAAMPDDPTFDMIRDVTVRSSATQVVVLANAAPRDALIGAVRAGAAGYMLKEVNPEDLIRGIRAAAAGGASLDRESTQALLDSVRDLAGSGRNGLFPTRGQSSELSVHLSERERTIAHLIAAGLTNRQIAEVLKLSPHTVKTYVSQILEKLGVSRRAAIAALEAGILDQRRVGGQPGQE